jgi:hypothetical protein
MGYYIFSYGIETEKIKAAFHSHDEKFLTSISKTDTFENYKDFLPEGKKTNPQKALEDIINNNPYDADSNFAYGYALICLCDYLGQELPYAQEIKLWVETDLIDKYLAEDFGVKDLVVNGSILFIDEPIPFDIPPRDDWPVISVVHKNQLAEIYKKLKHIKITDDEIETLFDSDDEDDEDKACAYEHIKGIIENIACCIEHNLDIINFAH